MKCFNEMGMTVNRDEQVIMPHQLQQSFDHRKALIPSNVFPITSSCFARRIHFRNQTHAFIRIIPSDSHSIGYNVMNGNNKTMAMKITQTRSLNSYFPLEDVAKDYHGDIIKMCEVRWTKDVPHIKRWKQLSFVEPMSDGAALHNARENSV